MAEKEMDGLKGCIAFLVMLITYPFLWAWSGYVFKVLWGWFVVPIGAPVVSVAQGAGLAALVMLVRGNRRLTKEEEAESFAGLLPGIIVRGMAIPAYILFVGWIAHWFMG